MLILNRAKYDISSDYQFFSVINLPQTAFDAAPEIHRI